MKLNVEGLGVASKVVHTAACNLTKIHGNFLGTTADRWLQLHDAKALPANGAVPLRVWPVYQASAGGSTPFGEGFIGDDVTLANGAVFAVSTTRATLTASADTMDIFVNGDSSWDNTDVSVAGDYTTLRETLQVWQDVNGPLRLVRLEVTDNALLDAAYVQIHAGDTPATNKIVASFPLEVLGALDLFFGTNGLSPRRVVNGTVFDGCTVALSSTPGTYTALGSSDVFIKASYR
jgi:hypothetical protein